MHSKTSLFTALVGTLALGACGSVAPSPSAFQARAPITGITTNQTDGLVCLGRLIDAAPGGPVEIVSGTIRDRTVPKRFEDRRLSKGGAWWIHTAVAKLNSRKVRTLEQGSKGRSGARQLVFEGAWTQDDRVGLEGNTEFNAVLGNVGFSLFGGAEYDLIVGDFTSVRNGRVVYASAVGAVISAGSGEAEFFVRDGLDSYAFEIGGGITEGPQMAQRQITESAVGAHLAAYYGVDFQDCVRGSTAASTNAAGNLAVNNIAAGEPAGFEQLSARDRNRALQSDLKSLGYYDGKLDGVWGPRSSAALQRFASDKRLPASRKPTAALYLAARDAAAKRAQ